MGFKNVVDYNEERYGNLFTLRNDGDSADVILLYQSKTDVLVADVHYIKSAEYSGYVHCARKNCPACQKGIRVQNKLFIPLYNINDGKIEFFDRSTRFEAQLMTDVLDKFPNPSEYVFRITRHGEANSYDTSYEIKAIAKNSTMPYAKILADNNASMPAYYENICKDLTPDEMRDLLSNGSGPAPTEEYNYVPTPRASASTPAPELEAYETPAVLIGGDAPVEEPPFSDTKPEVEAPSSEPVDSSEEVGEVEF